MIIKSILYIFIVALLSTSCGKSKAKKAEEAALQLEAAKNAETTNNRILGVARIEPEGGIMNILAGTSGRISAVLIKENDDVQKGQPLLNIEIAEEKAQLAQAKSKIGAQKALVQANKANLEAIEVDFKNAQETYDRDVKLYAIKGQTKQVLQDSKATMDKLEKEVDAAKATINQSNSTISELNADINYSETVIKQKKVTAPVAGKILFLPIKTGEYVGVDTRIAEFAPTGPYIAKTEVDELFADRVQLGQKAYILSQATGDTLATGMVSFAAEYLKQKSLFKDQNTEQEDRRVREVHIRLDEKANGKKPLIGSRVDCLINLK
jgi:multidrug resistance efflux pump